VCDLADNDCDGSVDEGTTGIYYLDADADGYSTGATASVCSVFNVGLRGYRSFDASTGTDDSGNGHTGVVLNGATFGTGKVGKTLILDGVNDYISVGTGSDLSSNTITIEAWFKRASTNTRDVILGTTNTA